MVQASLTWHAFALQLIMSCSWEGEQHSVTRVCARTCIQGGVLLLSDATDEEAQGIVQHDNDDDLLHIFFK